MHTNLHYWLAALHLPTIRPRKLLRWLQHFRSITELFHASKTELLYAGLTSNEVDMIQNPDWKIVENNLRWMQHPHQHILCIEDKDYPALLKEIENPPLVLFVYGDCSLLQKPQLAVVGSRRASYVGIKNAEQFAYHLATAGLVITSGLALGIDAASHRGALAAKGFTIAVMGTGLDYIYPKTHKALYEEIAVQNGAIISEFPLSTPPKALNFPLRNRIISGMSLGVLIVEAALKSGSLITAQHALEQGRDVFAIPGSIHQTLMRGCHSLIKQGAKLVECITDILEEMPKSFNLKVLPPTNQKTPVTNNLTPQQLRIFTQIEYEITSLDVIILRSGLTAGEVSSILLTLEMCELIQSVPGGYVRTLTN